MVKLIIGHTGTGKTKDIIQNANEALKTAKGNIIFINESNEGLLELNHNIRYVNISEFPIQSSLEFIAFLYGLLGSNYDIERIYLDGISNIYIMTPEEMCEWLEKINEIGKKYNIYFEVTLSHNGEVPEGLKAFI